MFTYKRLLAVLTVSFLILLLITPAKVFAIDNDLGLWTPVYIKLPITEKIKSQLGINPRIQRHITHINQLLVRPSIGYQLTKELSVWQGYAWVTNYLPKFVSENRIWQQVLYEKELKNFPRWSFSNRLRLEERFIQDISGVPVRIRNMIKFKYALDKRWSFLIYDEPFININSHFAGPQSGFDQNRFFVGLGKRITKDFNVEGGYLMQYINFTSPRHDRLNHNILINFYLTLPQLISSNKK